MTTDLDLKRRSILSPELPRQVASQALLEAVRATRHPHPDIGVPASYPAAVQAEAQRLLDGLMPFAVPVNEEVVATWLAPIMAGVVNVRQPADMPAWLAAVMLAVGHLERGAFTQATQIAAVRRFTFFPSAAHIYEIVTGPAAEIRTRRTVLERIVNGPTEAIGRAA